MSLYHYVRSKDELLDLMGDRIAAGQLVDEADLRRGWREGLTAIAQAYTGQLEAPPMDGRRPDPPPDHDPGPQHAAPHRPVAGGGRRPRARHSDQMEIIAVVDDYVIGFVVRSQRVAEYEEELDADTSRVDGCRLRPPPQPDRKRRVPASACACRPTAPRAARTRISGDGLERGALRARARAPARRHRGERQAGQAASWKMTPSVVRRPECTVATPWRMVAR